MELLDFWFKVYIKYRSFIVFKSVWIGFFFVGSVVLMYGVYKKVGEYVQFGYNDYDEFQFEV